MTLPEELASPDTVSRRDIFLKTAIQNKVWQCDLLQNKNKAKIIWQIHPVKTYFSSFK